MEEKQAYQTEFLRHIRDNVRQQKILCLDPGETMGWALFQGGYMTDSGQVRMCQKVPPTSQLLRMFFEQFTPCLPDICITENYIVYAHKLGANVWNPLFTVRLIGMIEFVCNESDLPIKYQMASEAKFFATDEKLQRWGIAQQLGKMKHAKDAVRHGLYYMLRQSQS